MIKSSLRGRRLIKSSVSIIGPVLKILFNKVLKSGIFLQLWSVGYISPVFKAGDIDDPNNYRGITVCSFKGKLFTLIINDRLTKYLDEHNIIHNNQIGFRKGHRRLTTFLFWRLLIDLYTKNDKKQVHSLLKKVNACFVDFQKAYDTIWRNGLFCKLMKYGFSQMIIFLLKSIQSIITDEGETITSKSTIVEKFITFFTNTVSKLLESVQSTTILGLPLKSLIYRFSQG